MAGLVRVSRRPRRRRRSTAARSAAGRRHVSRSERRRRSHVPNGGGPRAPGRSQRQHHRRRSRAARALGDAARSKSAVTTRASSWRACRPDRSPKHDEGETTALEWLSPRDAIAKFERRELLLPPPTWTTIRQLAKRHVDRRRLRVGAHPEDRARHARLLQGRRPGHMLTLPGDPLVSDHSRLGSAGGNALRAARRRTMAAAEDLIAAIDRVIALFNAKAMDLPDGFFDRRTQFVLNGSSFETLLGQPPNDPLVLMLARGPAGFRFTSKALQHAMPGCEVRARRSR